jgi:hypothetical protein
MSSPFDSAVAFLVQSPKIRRLLATRTLRCLDQRFLVSREHQRKYEARRRHALDAIQDEKWRNTANRSLRHVT